MGTVPASKSIQHGTATTVGNARQENASGLLKQLHRHVSRGSMGVAVIEFSGVLLGMVHQLFQPS